MIIILYCFNKISISVYIFFVDFMSEFNFYLCNRWVSTGAFFEKSIKIKHEIYESSIKRARDSLLVMWKYMKIYDIFN